MTIDVKAIYLEATWSGNPDHLAGLRAVERAAYEAAAVRAENYAAHNEDNEAYERQAASLDIAESIRALGGDK